MTTSMSLDPEWNYAFSSNMMIFGIMETVCLIIGIIMIVLYLRKNKLQGARVTIATIGIGFFTIIKLFSIFLG
jgi:hypothetical protein